MKLETLENAEYPQEEKYPSGSEVSSGLMWKFTEPVVGEQFKVHYGKLYHHFHTSTVTEILEKTSSNIKFKTKNSIYNILIQ
jgi:hypothetical protein